MQHISAWSQEAAWNYSDTFLLNYTFKCFRNAEWQMSSEQSVRSQVESFKKDKIKEYRSYNWTLIYTRTLQCERGNRHVPNLSKRPPHQSIGVIELKMSPLSALPKILSTYLKKQLLLVSMLTYPQHLIMPHNTVKSASLTQEARHKRRVYCITFKVLHKSSVPTIPTQQEINLQHS